jgi:hypothetical protein
MHIDEFTITKRAMKPGGSEIGWEVMKNGIPFAYIWTFRGKGYFYNARLVAAPNVVCGSVDTYREAEAWVRGQ